MNSTINSDNTLRIAVPCYGTRVLPRFGQAREFYFAEADLAAGTLHGLRRCSWDLVDEPHLVRWLRREGVAAVFCGGIHPRFQVALNAEGIGVVWGFRGEVEEVLRQWLREREPGNDNFADRVVGRTGCRLRRTVRAGCPHRDGQGERS